MSWIKTSFLWMMYRSGWGTKQRQEVTLAIWLKRSAFDEIIGQAVLSRFDPRVHTSEEAWRREVRRSLVRLQWDPDRNPSGGALERRAIQLGLRGAVLRKYAREWIVRIEDISDFVAGQREHSRGKAYDRLVVPSETVYAVEECGHIKKLEL
jgi:hypothetical protein